MKRENRWKWLAWAAMAAVPVLAIWGAGVSVQAQREAELEQGRALGLLSEQEAETYRGLFLRTAEARKKGPAPVLSGIDVYLVCGRKPAEKGVSNADRI